MVQIFVDRLNVDFLGLVDKTIGIGQVRMSTLAMALGWIPLIEHERISGHASAADEISEEFFKLNTDQMWELFRMLKWSKSAIHALAKILDFLKNRSNRYPTLSRSEFSQNTRAVSIIGSEYNLGAANSPLSSASPSSYGSLIGQLCSGVYGDGYLQFSTTIGQFTH